MNKNIDTVSEVVEVLDKYEAKGMRCQPDIIWSKADGHIVIDINGISYIDFSSGVMITNSGHNCLEIKKAILEWLETGIYTSYMFPNLAKAKLLQSLSDVIPENYKVALFSTGAESAEAAIKIARLWGMKNKAGSKNLIISYINSFHGRTLGAQCIGGINTLKQWVPEEMTYYLVRHVPFPDTMYSKNINFEGFQDILKVEQLEPKNIAAVIIECYQGGIGSFAPKEYMGLLSKWCNENDVLLIVDEIQSGFGRTGKFWAYEHYDFLPDIILAGKGISSSLPLSAVIARPEIIDLCPQGTLNTTHSGNPLCCAAAEANIEFIKNNNLANRAENTGKVLYQELKLISHEFPNKIRAIFSKGLMAAIHLGNSISETANPTLAKKLVTKCIENGLLLYNPGGPENSTIKISPPLTIDEKAIIKGCHLIRKSIQEIE